MSFASNKPIYALAAALGAAVIVLGVISVSAIVEMQKSKEDLKSEITQLKNSMANGSTSPISISPITMTNNQQEKTITVTGTARSIVEPDKLVISLAVETRAETAQEAVGLNAEKMESVVKAVKELGIDEREIRTSYFNVYPDYDRSRPAQIVGFVAQNTITISTSATSIPAGKIIDTAIGAGANRIDNTYFAISPEVGAKLWQETVDNALSDATMKAERILLPMDMKIVGVKSINPDYIPYPIFHPGMRTTLGDALLPPSVLTPFYGGNQEFTVNVTVTFLIA
jgi:hypothetical protein